MYWPHLILHFSSLTLTYTSTYPYTYLPSIHQQHGHHRRSPQRPRAHMAPPPSWPSAPPLLPTSSAKPTIPTSTSVSPTATTDLKEKFKRMCEKSMIKKRHMHLTEEFLKENPNMCVYMAPSLDVRQDMVVVEVPRLGIAAAVKAIEEWGQPKSMIPHLVFCTTSGVYMPGADYQLTKLLDLRPCVKRLMMYQQGCAAGGTVLRLPKDLAGNSRGARVLVVCSEITALLFRGPSETQVDSLVGQALFVDGAAAIIVGAYPDTSVERPIFQLVSAAQAIWPDSVFRIMNPGGRAIVDQTEEKLGLEKEKLEAIRHVLSEYGNLVSPCLLFILDDLRFKSLREGKATTGEGLQWGVLFGFGPGITAEADH